jgi:K+ transporter
MRDRWGWSAPTALLKSGLFLIVDLAFVAADLLKIVAGATGSRSPSAQLCSS